MPHRDHAKCQKVSDPKTMSTTEAWMWVDTYANGRGNSEQSASGGGTLLSVCKGATPNSLPTETLRRLRHYGYGNFDFGDEIPETGSAGALPTFLHYCQNYDFAKHTWAKRKMSHNFFSCDGSPLELNVDAMLRKLHWVENDPSMSANQRKKEARTAFMLCHLIPLMNMALDDYKRDVCG